MEKLFGIRVLRHLERKPGGGAALREITGDARVVVVGDRLFTDVVFANLNGHHSVLVDPLDASQDNFVVRSVRRLEKTGFENEGFAWRTP